MAIQLRPLAFAIATASLWAPLVQAEHIHHRNDEITDVLVTAPEQASPLGGTVLPDEDFHAKRAASSDSAQMLKGIPGVSLQGAGGVSSLPVIRGLADDRLRIKVDGMDLVSACGNHMNPALSYIDPTAVDSIQVFAGIAPVSLGGDSIGGTVVVESAAPQFAKTQGDVLKQGGVGAFYRSNGDGQGVNAAFSAANDLFSLRYSGAFAKADNYRAGDDFKAAGLAATGRGWLDGDEVGSTAYESQNHKLGLALQRENHLFDIDAGYQHIPYQGFPNQRMDMLDNTSKQLALSHQGTYDWGVVESRIYREETRHKMNFGDDKQFWYGNAPGMPMETEGENTGLSLTTEYRLSARDLLRLGGDLQQYRLDDWWPPSGTGMMMAPNTFWNIRNGERDRYALFGEWQAKWSAQWLTLVGVRHETVQSNADTVQGYSMMYAADAAAFNAQDRSQNDNNWDFSAQSRYTPSNLQSYEIGLARKTRSPNLYERYSWSTVGMAMRMVNLAGDGNGYVGNVDLEPEIAHSLSVSADWHDARREHWQLVITPYYTLVDDYIDATPCTTMMCNASNALPGFRYLTFTNDDAHLFGVDVSGFRHLASLDSLGALKARLVAGYVKGENQRTNDNLYNLLPLNATFSLEQSKGNWQNRLEWQVVDAKDDTSATRNEIPTAGYGLMHVRSSFSWRDVRFDFGVENVLDKGYHLPQGGAYLGQGMTMSGNGVPWGIAVPGPGRSLYAGVNYRFY